MVVEGATAQLVLAAAALGGVAQGDDELGAGDPARERVDDGVDGEPVPPRPRPAARAAWRGPPGAVSACSTRSRSAGWTCGEHRVPDDAVGLVAHELAQRPEGLLHDPVAVEHEQRVGGLGQQRAVAGLAGAARLERGAGGGVLDGGLLEPAAGALEPQQAEEHHEHGGHEEQGGVAAGGGARGQGLATLAGPGAGEEVGDDRERGLDVVALDLLRPRASGRPGRRGAPRSARRGTGPARARSRRCHGRCRAAGRCAPRAGRGPAACAAGAGESLRTRAPATVRPMIADSRLTSASDCASSRTPSSRSVARSCRCSIASAVATTATITPSSNSTVRQGAEARGDALGVAGSCTGGPGLGEPSPPSSA